MTQLFSLTKRFFQEEDGQDTMEYTLLLGFVALSAAAIFPPIATSISKIWCVANKHLANAANAAGT